MPRKIASITQEAPVSVENLDVAYTPLATRLGRFYGLSQADIALLDALPYRQQQFGRDQPVLRRGDELSETILMISGWAARVRYTPAGGRQIIHILLPGDLLTGDVFMLHRSDHEFVTITDTMVRFIKPRDMQNLLQCAPGISAALWWVSEQENGMVREQVVRLGRRSALERTAHFILELHRRLLLVQQATEDAFILPITQSDISDALGLSPVHINRTLNSLFKMGLIARRKSVVELRDRDSLAELCDFDLSHFHLDSVLSQAANR